MYEQNERSLLDELRYHAWTLLVSAIVLAPIVIIVIAVIYNPELVGYNISVS